MGMNMSNLQTALSTGAAPDFRAAVHGGKVELTTEAGMVVQSLQANEKIGFEGAKIKVPMLETIHVIGFIEQFPGSALANEFRKWFEGEQRSCVLRPAVLNGATSVPLELLTVAALNTAIGASAVVSFTKAELLSVFNGSILVAYLAECSGKNPEISEAALLLSYKRQIAVLRDGFLALSVKGSTSEIAVCKKLLSLLEAANAAELLPADGIYCAASLKNSISQMQSRTEAAAELFSEL